MAYSDLKGLAVSTSSSEALHAYERGLDLFLRWRGGAMDALNAAVKADPRFVLAHCARALIAWRMGQVAVASSAHRAGHGVGRPCSRRARALARADRRRPAEEVTGRTAQALLERASEDYPLDRLMVRSVGLNCIARGDYEGGISISRRSLDADPDEPQFMTMLGFFLEQSGYNDEGLAMSARSLALDPTNLYTYHAVAHAYQARGDYPKALETFERAASLERYAHILWHLAEARSILGLRAVHARLLGLHDARLTGARARGAALAPRDAAAHPDRRRGLEGAGRGGRAATGARRCLDPLDASLDRSGLRPRRGDGEGRAAGRLPATACPRDVRAGTGPRRARTSSKGNSRSSGATRREPCS